MILFFGIIHTSVQISWETKYSFSKKSPEVRNFTEKPSYFVCKNIKLNSIFKMWRRKGGGLYLKLYRAGLPEYEEEVFDQQDQNPGQVEGSSLMILLPDRPQLTEILIQDQSQDFRQFNQNYLVQLDLHSSIRSTQFNQIYLVQLDLPS